MRAFTSEGGRVTAPNVIPLRPRVRLLPLSDEMRRATLTSYRAGGITRSCAEDQLIKLGMKPVDAAREVADAIQL